MSVSSINSSLLVVAVVTVFFGSAFSATAKPVNHYNCHDGQSDIFQLERSCTDEIKQKRKKRKPKTITRVGKQDWKKAFFDDIANNSSDGGGGGGGGRR